MFSNVSDSNAKKEIAIFLTPHIITGENEMMQLKEDQGKPRKPFRQ
jgi:type II secretory pathway component GspD/PulD (secretin)